MADSNLDRDNSAAGNNHLMQIGRMPWLKVLVGTFMALVAAGSVYLAYPEVYRTESKLLLRRSVPDGEDPTRGPELLLAETVMILTAWETLACARKMLVQQNQVSSDLSAANRSEAEAVGTMQENLQVAGTAPAVITLKYRSENSREGPAVLDAIVGSYLKQLEEWEERAMNAATRKLTIARMRVEELEKRLREVHSAAKIVPAANAEAALEEALKDAQRDANATSDELAEVAAQIAALEKRTDPQGLDNARVRLEALRAKKAAIEARMADLAAKMSKVGLEIARLRRELVTEQEAYERLADRMMIGGFADERGACATPNVAILQRPLGPALETGRRDVLMGVLVGLGPLLGLALGRWRSGSAF